MILKYFSIISVFLFACAGDSNGPQEKIINMNDIPSVVDFGELVIGELKDVQVTITNAVESNEELSATISISGTNFSINSGANTVNLNPGQTETIEIRLTSDAKGSFNGTLTITHNATNQVSPIDIQLTGTVDDKSAEIATLILEGWQLFEAKNYYAAETKFSTAISLTGNSSTYESFKAEAESGRGWALAKKRNFSSAKTLFMNSISRPARESSTDLNSNAGLAFINHALNDFNSAIQHSLYVLNADQNYIFDHDSKVFHKSIRLVLAQSYYSIGDFQNAAAQLDILDPLNAPHSTAPDVLLKQIQDLLATI